MLAVASTHGSRQSDQFVFGKAPGGNYFGDDGMAFRSVPVLLDDKGANLFQ